MKSKVKLTTDNLSAFFASVPCECDSKVIVADLDIDDVCYCGDCDRPLVLRSRSGQWYYIGDKVFE